MILIDRPKSYVLELLKTKEQLGALSFRFDWFAVHRRWFVVFWRLLVQTVSQLIDDPIHVVQDNYYVT
jgi:hypothetical protein